MQQAAAQTPWRLHYHTKRAPGAYCTKPRKPQKDWVLTSAVDRTASPRGEQRQTAHRCDPSHNHQLSATTKHILVNTKHLYNICTMLVQRRRRCADILHMLYKGFVFAGIGPMSSSSAKWKKLKPAMFFMLIILMIKMHDYIIYRKCYTFIFNLTCNLDFNCSINLQCCYPSSHADLY